MEVFLKGQMDYILFGYGLAFIALSAMCFAVRSRDRLFIRWFPLGLFGLLHGIAEWLGLLALSLGDPPLFSRMRFCLVFFSFLWLVEFGRSNTAPHWRRAAIGSFYAALVLLVLSGGYAGGGVTGLGVCARYFCCLPGAVWGAVVLFEKSSQKREGRRALKIAAGGMLIYAAAAGLIVPRAGLFPAVVISQESLLQLTGVPVHLIRGCAAFVIAIGIWHYYLGNLAVSARSAAARHALFYALFVIVAFGWMLTQRHSLHEDAGIRRRLMLRSANIAASIDMDRLRNLVGSPQDEGASGYERIRYQLAAARSVNPDVRYVYLLGFRAEKIFFLADSEPVSSPRHAPPGREYGAADTDMARIFSGGAERVETARSGPGAAQGRVFVPVRARGSPVVMAVLGMDLDVSDWQIELLRQRLDFILAILPFSVFFIILITLLQQMYEDKERLNAGEQRFRAQSEFLGTIVDSISHPFYVIDAGDYTIKLANSAARLGDISGAATCHALTHQSRIPCAREHVCPLARVKETKEPVTTEHLHYGSDGEKCFMEVRGYPVFNKEGEVVQMIEYNLDITDRKKAEIALKEYAEKLAATNKELDDFTYIISHDLKEPLRSIDAFSRFLEADYKDNLGDEGKNYLSRIRANAVRMQRLIEDLLEISRIERKEGFYEEAETGEILSDVMLRLDFALKQKNVAVCIQDNMPRIFCDRIRLTEVFANLISNAVKFNDKPDPRVEIGWRQDGGWHEFRVADNGPGIEERYFEKIFQIFQRLNKREDHEGTGAGLTIAKKIVCMHKGRIWVESKRGEGACFHFTIPRNKEEILNTRIKNIPAVTPECAAEGRIYRTVPVSAGPAQAGEEGVESGQ